MAWHTDDETCEHERDEPSDDVSLGAWSLGLSCVSASSYPVVSTKSSPTQLCVVSQQGEQSVEPRIRQTFLPCHRKGRNSTGGCSRAWCFTLNNPTEDDWTVLNNITLDQVRYLIVGDEVGEKGTPHCQGYVYFENKKSFNQVKDLLPKGVHLEKSKGSAAQNQKYCSKEQTKIELGVCPQQGKRKDIDVIRDLIRDGKRLREIVEVASSYQAIRTAEKIFEHKENKRHWPTEVYWYHGPTGSGKSRKAFEVAPDAWISGESLKWWQGYDGHEDVILDDFRADSCKLHTLLRILDRYPYTVEVKGGSRQLLAKRIFITTPKCPQETYYNCDENIAQLLRRITKIEKFPLD